LRTKVGGGVDGWVPDPILVILFFESLAFDVVVFIWPLAACAWLGGNVLLSGEVLNWTSDLILLVIDFY
jgi:hypothetical protein